MYACWQSSHDQLGSSPRQDADLVSLHATQLKERDPVSRHLIDTQPTYLCNQHYNSIAYTKYIYSLTMYVSNNNCAAMVLLQVKKQLSTV